MLSLVAIYNLSCIYGAYSVASKSFIVVKGLILNSNIMGAASSSCSPCLCRERRDLLEEAAVGQQQDVSLVHVPAVASREEPKATTQQQVVVQERKVRTKKLKIVAEQDPDIIEELETPKQKQFLNFEQLIKEEEDNIEEEEDNIEEENIEQEQAVKEEKTITKPHIVHVQVTAEVHVDPSSVTTGKPLVECCID